MVTHDPVAAAYAHRVLFLADGRLVGELSSPDPCRRARSLGRSALGRTTSAPADDRRPACRVAQRLADPVGAP